MKFAIISDLIFLSTLFILVMCAFEEAMNLDLLSLFIEMIICFLEGCHIQVYLSGNNVPVVKPSLNHTSLPSTAATFLTTCLMVASSSSTSSQSH